MASYTLVHVQGREKLLKFSSPVHIYQYFKNYRIDLLSGRQELFSPDDLRSRLDQYQLRDDFSSPLVIHMNYELGYLLNGMEDQINDDQLLLTEIEYTHREEVVFPDVVKSNIDLQEVDSVDFGTYQQMFEICRKNLLDGNCYQVNLTHLFRFSFSSKLNAEYFCRIFFSQTEKLGAYAHATYLEPANKLILSNSPECLFKIVAGEEKGKLGVLTMPIKGTIGYLDGDDFSQKWQELYQSRKDSGELNMITDLLRNDLSRIDTPSTRVLHKKLPLVVPGIIHQYSRIFVEVAKSTSLLRHFLAVFPGGSITGAPKRRVMEIIKSVEKHPRGIYCGSTVVMHKSFKAASINIRTAWIDFDKSFLDYGSGGGVTLLSDVQSEYQEMKIKLRSFMDMFSEDIK